MVKDIEKTRSKDETFNFKVSISEIDEVSKFNNFIDNSIDKRSTSVNKDALKKDFALKLKSNIKKFGNTNATLIYTLINVYENEDVLKPGEKQYVPKFKGDFKNYMRSAVQLRAKTVTYEEAYE